MFDVLQKDLSVERYVFVEASAGTGKTFSIEHLAVRLILSGIPISRLLIMTFTKAARTELVRRIHARLLKSLESLESGQEKTPYLFSIEQQEGMRLLRAALQSFHEARITTIHGFCQSLLTKYAFEADISLAYFDVQGKERQQENILNYLQGHLNKKSVFPVQLEIAMKACKKIQTLIKRISESAGENTLEFSVLIKQIDETIIKIGSCEKEKVEADFCTLKEHYNKFKSCIHQGPILAQWLEEGKCDPVQVEILLRDEVYYWDLVHVDNLNKSKAKKNIPIVLNYPLLTETFQKQLSPLLQIGKDVDIIIATLASGYQNYHEEFVGGIKTFDDLLIAMRDAVEKPQFYEKVRTEFDAAIIDEFQDTDAVQWEIAQKIFMQERPLKAFYLVGDPKQSIYAFRKADLYSYIGARDHFQVGERAHLSVNYRSEKSLIGSLNALFCSEKMAGWMSLPKQSSVIPVTSVYANKDAQEDSIGSKENGTKGSLHFLLIESETSRGNFPQDEIHKRKLAPYLISEILRLKELDLFTLSKIALLVKDHHQAAELMHELEKAGIASVFVRSAGIVDSPVYATMLALLSTLHTPHDHYVLKRFLISPAMNLDLEDFSKVSLPEYAARMHELKNIFHKEGLTACLQRALDLPFPRGTLFEMLFSEGDASFYEDFQHIEELILEKNHKECSLAKIILFLEEIRFKDIDENKHLQRRASETENAVTVMTMHASKGLEFDVVFAVGLFVRTHSRDAMDVKEKDAEKMRLLYVAMTRAKRRLYVPIVIDKKQSAIKPGFASPIELFCQNFIQEAALTLDAITSSLEHFQKQAAITWEVLAEIPSGKLQVSKKEEIHLAKPARFSPSWQKQEIVSFSSLFQKDKTQRWEKIEEVDESLPLGADTGTLVHMIMEDLFKRGLHHPLAEDKIRALIQTSIQGTSFEGHEDKILAMILGALTVPLQTTCGSFCLSEVAPSSLMTEMEFCYLHQNQLRKGFIDLWFFHKGYYFLVDWKTNCLPQYTREKLGSAMQEHGYHLQAALYADALKRYVKLFDIRPFEECFGGAHYLFLRGAKWESFMPDLTLVT